ncbi:MAG: exo-alpha-sialidase [Clostridia bacterium]|nr:exo-alpha-sialidase [Clostridia bacterium]
MTDIKIITEMLPDDRYSEYGGGSFACFDDKILFAYPAAHRDNVKVSDILVRVSSDGGESWSEPVTATLDGEILAGEYSGVSLLKLADGSIGLFLVEGDGTGWKSRIVFGISSDGFAYSLKCADCSFDIYTGLFIMENDAAVQLQSGRILLPLCYRFGDDKGVEGTAPDERAFVGFSYSDNGGENFMLAHDDLFQSFSGTEHGLRHPGAIEIFPDVLHSYFSTDRMCQYSAFSTDGGLEWSQSEPSDFSSPSAPMKIAKNPYSGKYYAVFNPIPEYVGRVTPSYVMGRTPLVMAELSSDSRRPEKIFPICECECKGYSDPAVTFISSDEFLLSYTVTDESGRSLAVMKGKTKS